MIEQVPAVTEIAHLIQLAIAPVFLLAGIGSILNVLAQRLARAVDRARRLEAEFESLEPEDRQTASAELRLLDRRMTVANLAISCCTASASLVCIVVAILFVADLAEFRFGRVIAWLFIATMTVLISGLLLFLYEVRLAMRSIRLRRDQLPHLRRPEAG
jgi:MFS family permease